jgi:hypothetical protein
MPFAVDFMPASFADRTAMCHPISACFVARVSEAKPGVCRP